jgi:hypothetical protein
LLSVIFYYDLAYLAVIGSVSWKLISAGISVIGHERIFLFHMSTVIGASKFCEGLHRLAFMFWPFGSVFLLHPPIPENTSQ